MQSILQIFLFPHKIIGVQCVNAWAKMHSFTNQG